MEEKFQNKVLTQQFLTRIDIHKLLDIGELSIDLDKDSIRHLIVTGKNGSGKTTFINKLKGFIMEVLNSSTLYDKLDQLKPLSNSKDLSSVYDSENSKIAHRNFVNNLVAGYG